MGWWSGSKSKVKQYSNLSPEQQPLQNQLIQSALGQGAGGASGAAADYYRGLLGNNNEDYESLAGPQMRQFNEEIIPGLSEQFAGMGSGGLSSSGFRNAALSSGVDLAERLGAIRANLRQAGAQGLQNISQQALQPTVQNVMMQGQPGFGQALAGGVGSAIGGALPSFLGQSYLNSWGSKPVNQGGAI